MRKNNYENRIASELTEPDWHDWVAGPNISWHIGGIAQVGGMGLNAGSNHRNQIRRMSRSKLSDPFILFSCHYSSFNICFNRISMCRGQQY